MLNRIPEYRSRVAPERVVGGQALNIVIRKGKTKKLLVFVMDSQNGKNHHFLIPNEPNVGESKIAHVVEKNGKFNIFSSSNENIAKVRFSGHHLKWSFSIIGKTNRVPSKRVRMRNWNRDIFKWKGSTVILNISTMEIWLKSKPYKPTKNASGVIRMIYANWNKADLIAREFSQFAQIAIKPIKTDHPADISHAHLVLTKKDYNPILKPMSDIKDDVGLHFDKSHPNLPEFSGSKSVEGAAGAEWFFTKFPEIVKHQVEMDARFADNLKLHLEVLREIRDAIKQLKKANGDSAEDQK